MAQVSENRIQSLDRGLQLLEYIAEQDRAVRLRELAELLGVEKMSAHRLVNTLVDRGYVKQDAETLGYVIGEKMLAVACRPASQHRLLTLGRSYVRELARQTHETAHLAVRSQDSAVLIDNEYGDQPVGVTSQCGNRVPLYCSGVGKALIADMDHAELNVALGGGRLRRYTANTITRMADLEEGCRQVQREGVAYDRAEHSLETSCIAAPVRDFRCWVLAAIGISGPTSRFTEEVIQQLTPIVKQYALALSLELGSQAEDSRAKV